MSKYKLIHKDTVQAYRLYVYRRDGELSFILYHDETRVTSIECSVEQFLHPNSTLDHIQYTMTPIPDIFNPGIYASPFVFLYFDSEHDRRIVFKVYDHKITFPLKTQDVTDHLED